jgi:hypothetical protein
LGVQEVVDQIRSAVEVVTVRTLTLLARQESGQELVVVVERR